MIQVSEQKLNDAIAMYRELNEAEPTGMVVALETGQIFRAEGLTPLYVLDSVTGLVFATSEEMMDGKFN